MITDNLISSKEKNKINILLVEHNPVLRKQIASLLNHWNFHFDISTNGKHCIDALKLNKYNLILMDVRLPEMDGPETTKYIRKTLKLNLPIIAITSNASEAERRKCLSAGINDYLMKPTLEPIPEDELYNLTVNYLLPIGNKQAANKLFSNKPSDNRVVKRIKEVSYEKKY